MNVINKKISKSQISKREPEQIDGSIIFPGETRMKTFELYNVYLNGTIYLSDRENIVVFAYE